MRLFPRRLAVALAATAGTTIALLAPATVAQAADGHVDKKASVHGVNVKLNGVQNPEDTALWALKLSNGETVTMYCVDKAAKVIDGAPMVEKQWAQFPPNPQADPAKVVWVLHNSFPAVSLPDLTAKLNLPGLDLPEAIGGTQAAIWHFTDGSTLAPTGNSTDVKALYDYLVANAKPIADIVPQLELAPKTLSGEAGKNIGPFEVKTNATQVTLKLVDAPQGASIVDEKGQPVIGPVANGTKVFIKTTNGASGKATITADASWQSSGGRLFVGEGDVKTQALVVPKVDTKTATAQASAEWTFTPAPSPTPSPTPTPSPSVVPSAPGKGAELPKTGSDVTSVAVAGSILLLLGGAAVFLARRRRISPTA